MAVVEITITPPGGSPLSITDDCVFSRCSFSSQMGAVAGRFDVYVRDTHGTYSFTTGSEILLTVDGVPMFGGYLLMKGMTSFAPAADTTSLVDYQLRLWHLSGPDYNVVLDKRIFRSAASNYQKSITVGSAVDGVVLRTALGSYADLSDFDTTSMIADIATQPDTTHIVIQQGWPLRKEFETLLNFSGAVYYVRADKVVVWQPYEAAVKRWGFSDQPNRAAITASPDAYQNSTWGFREVEVTEDGTYLANDIFMWGGTALSQTGGTVVARYQDATSSVSSGTGYYIQDGTVTGGSSIDTHGRWQYAEQHFGDSQYASVNQVKMAAENMLKGSVSGTLGTAKGLRNPQWQATFKWNSENVPLLSGTPDHIRAGDLVTVDLNTFGLVKLLPVRSLTITFPDASEDGTESGRIVEFEGTFGLQLSDSYLLWTYIRKHPSSASAPAASAATVPVVDAGSTTTVYGASFVDAPAPACDGSTTVFTIEVSATPAGYVPGTLQVWLNGLIQRKGTDYTESGPSSGDFTMTSAPLSTDTLIASCTLLGN